MRTRGKPAVVVVTGASAGVGRAAAREFARQGASVALLARNAEALEGACAEVRQFGARPLACPLDVSDAAAVDRAAADIESRLGPIDVWVNNAMVTVVSPVELLQADELRRVTEVTYLGAAFGTLAALRRMAPRNRGTIVQVGSALAYRAIPLQAAYCAAKFALRGFTDSLRCELLHQRSAVRVTMVHLPAINTPQFDWCRTRMPRKPRPVAPVFQPEVAARAIVWAASHPRREVHVGSSTFSAIWGNKIVPHALDRYLGMTGYDSQLDAEPVEPSRRDNLFEHVPGDPGAHGRFDSEAVDRSPTFEMAAHRNSLALTLGLAALGVFLGQRAGTKVTPRWR